MIPRRHPRLPRWPLIQWLMGPPGHSCPPDPDTTVRARAASRIRLVGGLIFCSYFALSAKASVLMLTSNPQLEQQAKTQFEHSITINGRRGDLLDRNQSILATTVDMMAAHADPKVLSELTDQEREEIAQALAQILDKKPQDISKRLARNKKRDVLLARRLSPEPANQVTQVIKKLSKKGAQYRKAIWLATEQQRFYPSGAEAAQLIGIVGHNGTGLVGLERTLDADLRGGTYKYVLWRDRKGRRVTPEAIKAQEGHSVVLTLDKRIQHSAEAALDDLMERSQPSSAYAMVMDVHTGELLAMANRPTQNPNNTTKLNLSAFKNHAALDAPEPGSVFKPFVIAGALEDGLVTVNSSIDCEGGNWRVGRNTIHDDHPHDFVSLPEVIKYSSNIGTAKLALQMGAESTIQTLRSFGFGKPSKLGLPGETQGFIRAPDKIKPIELATTAFGQGVTSSGVQLISAMSALANHGKLMKPMLVSEIRDATGSLVRAYKPKEVRQAVDAEVADQVVKMMIGVTEEGGTGTNGRIPGYLVAGKTGTAQKVVDGRYSPTARVASFIGVVPADNPEIAIVVLADTPTKGLSYGGIVSAPAFAQIGADAMRILGIAANPDLEEQEDQTQTAHQTQTAQAELPPVKAPPELVWTKTGQLSLPNLSGLSLRDALVSLQGAGLTVSMSGTGRVIDQSPRPGSAISAGDQVEVRLQ